ncbi:MAG: hypothetical protein R3267_04350 [Paenisporosarcina sp.]|nr:hypothetical protein [Paenisporosarcina sp.]
MKSLFLFILLASSVWTPVKEGEVIGPIIFAKACGDNFVIGIDENRNGIIDTCYEFKNEGDKLLKKHVKIWFDIQNKTTLVGQGCVCNK